MITPTRRDLVVAALTASVCLGLTGFIGHAPLAADVPGSKPEMGSMAFMAISYEVLSTASFTRNCRLLSCNDRVSVSTGALLLVSMLLIPKLSLCWELSIPYAG